MATSTAEVGLSSRLRGRLAFVALAMAVLSAVTGAWMLLAADKL